MKRKKNVYLYINKNDCMLCSVCTVLDFQENRKKNWAQSRQHDID